jgi:hypothetical protein
MNEDTPVGEIEIPLPGGIPSTAPRNQKIKQWTNVIATGAALIMAVAAAIKPNDPVNKAGYQELKSAIEQSQKNEIQNHDDIVALRNYLDGYFKGTGTPLVLPPTSSSAPPPSAHPKNAVVVVKARSSSAIAMATAAPPPPPLPDFHVNPPVKPVANYDDIKPK